MCRRSRAGMLRDQLGERLIEESGANFEAPVVNQFSEPAGEARAGAEGRGGRAAEDHARRRAWQDRRGRADQEAQAPREHARRGAGQAVDAAGPAKVRARGQAGASEVRTRRKAGACRQIRRQARSFCDIRGQARGEAARRKETRTRAAADRAAGPAQGECLDGAGRTADRHRPGRCRKGRGRGQASRQEGLWQAGRKAELWQAAGRASARRWPKGRPAEAERAGRGEEMRIVGGEFRGRPLATPRSQSIRPTTDRTREAVFNVLAHRFPAKARRRARARPFRRHRRARAGGAVARRGALPVHRGIGRRARPDPHQCRSLRPAGSHQDLPPRRDRSRRGRHDRRRSAWSSPIRPTARGSARRRCARRCEAAGCCPARFASSRRRRRPHFDPGEGFSMLDERDYGDTVIRFIEATGAP